MSLSPNDHASEIAALRAEIAACSACVDLPLGPRPLVQIGHRARILIAGQAPGRKTHQAGRPFDDVSGRRLRQWLGLDEPTFRDPDLVAMVPMGFCYPGTGRSGDLPPRPECAALWRERVLRQMPSVELILILGRHAQSWHMPESARMPLAVAMRDWRRHWPGRLLLPHPSPRNMGWIQNNSWFETEILPELRKRIADLVSRCT